jgi:hypothetical protein
MAPSMGLGLEFASAPNKMTVISASCVENTPSQDNVIMALHDAVICTDYIA